MIEILPGILEKDWFEIERKIELVKPFATAVHIDILDGKFAPNTSLLDPEPFKKYSKDVFFEAHLMVEEPIDYLKPFADAGFRRFLGHVEKMSDQVEFVARGQLLGEVGLALDAVTPLDALTVPLDDLDTVLVMTVRAGFSGQQFMSEQLKKVRKLSFKTSIPIEIDGGVSDISLPKALHAGVRRCVATSFLYNDHDASPEKRYQKLKILSS